MYKVGDLIIYGNTGVCKVSDITTLDFGGAKKKELYYVLSPLYDSSTIYIPTNNTKVFMRPIITKEEANELIDMIPTFNVDTNQDLSTNQLIEHYKKKIKTHDCEDLIKLCMTTYAKQKDAEEQNRKLGAIDTKFMKQAEKLLFGELAAALGIDIDKVPDYIQERIDIQEDNPFPTT